VHETTVESYPGFDRESWRVTCVQCGLAADDLEVEQAGLVAEVMGRRMCGSVVGGHSQRQAGPPAAQASASNDEQILSAWTGGVAWPSDDVAIA
jgi:hypothetical protein